MSRPVSRLARGRTAAGLGITLLLASCLYAGPPQVAPSATLAPGDDLAHGPRTRGELAVSFAGPRGLVVDGDDAAVTVLFNRAMRALEAAEDAGLPEVSVRTKDGRAVPGATRWVGTRGLLFTPAEGLPGASDFVVTVAAARSLDGGELRAPYLFEFQTSLPALTGSSPNHGARSVRAEDAFHLHFNHDVAPEAVAKIARLVVKRGDGDAGAPVPVRASRLPPIVEKDPAHGRPAHVIVLTPEKPLPLDAGVELTLDAGLASTEGPRTSDRAFTVAARTYGPLRLVSFHCPRIAPAGPCRAQNDIKVTLSNPVSPEEFHRHVKAPAILAKPGPTGGKKKKEQKEAPGPSQWLLADPQLGKKYRVTLTAGMTDLFGQTLAQDQTFEIVTESPFSGNSAAVARAPQPPTTPDRAPDAPPAAAGPRRPSLRYELELGLSGHVVEALASNGVKSHRLPVSSINVATYELGSASLAEEQTLAWLGGGGVRDFLDRNHIVPELVTPGAQENVRAVRSLDLDALLSPTRGRGAAFVFLDVPGDAPAAPRLVSVTDLGVSAKLSHFGSLVWVTSLASGKPVIGATVSLRTPGKAELFRGTTDPEGTLTIPADAYDPFPEPSEKKKPVGEVFAFVRSGDDWTYQRLARSNADALAASAFQDFTSRGEWVGTIFTDRGVYRPGETVKAGGIFRAIDAGGLHAVPGKEVRLEVKDGRGGSVATTRAKLDAFGAFAVDLPLPKTAHLGDARIVASLRDRGRESGASETFRLLAYKASEFKVGVEAASPTYVRGDEAEFTVRGDYLFGAPMGEAPVHTTMTREQTSFVPPGADGFVVNDDGGVAEGTDDSPKASDLTAADDKLGTDGRFSRKARLFLPAQRGPERVTFEAEVEDVSRQTIAARASVLVHPAEFYAALRVPSDRFINAGNLFHAEVAALEPGGARRAGVPLKVELLERTWVAAVEEHGDGTSHRASRANDAVVASCALVSSPAPVGCDLKVPEGGFYLVRVSATDRRGNKLTASTSFYGIEDRNASPAPVAWADSDARVVTLEPNKKSYELGEQARFLVRSPFKEADALVTVERNGILWKTRTQVTGPMPVITIPVEAAFYPNAYVSVHLVRGRVQAAPEKGADLGGPEFRMAYGQLTVNPEAHRLRVEIAPDKKDYQPGAEVDAELIVRDHNGAPMESELTFYAVDEGVLMLTGYKTPDPLPVFTRRRALAVFTAESREGLAHVLPFRSGERVPVLGFELLQARAAVDKGDPGGDGGGGGLRADFRSTAYFEAGKVTDNQGHAHVHFKLPDNLTTFRLMAVAAGASDYFGSGEASITTHRKLMARPALPRQLRVGDAFDASVALSSSELPEATVEVTLLASGVELTGAATQTVRLPKTGAIEARFPVKATTPGEATFEFALKSGRESDRVRVKRKVELAVSVESIAAYGETTSAASVALGDLASIRPDRGGLTVKVAPTALVGLSAGLEQLLDYPYGCTEQLASRTLPLLSLRDLATDYGAHLPARVDVALEDAIDKLLKNQRDDGGFGFWDDSARSEPWLSAYATLTLVEAKKQARFVPAEAVDAAVLYLETSLRRTKIGDDGDAPEPGDDPATGDEPAAERGALAPEKKAALDYANAAFVADVLATIGKPDPGFLHRLYDGRKGKALFAQALLLHGMATAGMSQPELDGLARELEARLRIGANEAVADGEQTDLFAPMLDSSARTTALVLRAFVAADRRSPLASRLARGLLGLREHGGAWRSTQENGWALMALRDYRAAQESSTKDVEVRAFLGPDELLHRVFRAGTDRETTVAVGADRVARAGGQAITFQVAGAGQLFYAAELRYATTVLPERPRDEGFFVQKMMRALGPEDLEEASQWLPRRTMEAAKAGDLVLVDLLLESSEPRKQVVLDDPLPAGLEAVDYDLETTARSRRVGDERRGDADARKKRAKRPDELLGLGAAFRTATVHREVHDDRVLTFIEDLAPGMYHFRYVARATAIGRYVMPPTRVECMYAPEVYGRTAASHFEVTAKKP